MRPCGWCKKDIGRGARVCPHCYRGQGIWILVTAFPTWLTGLAAIAAAVGAAYFVNLAREDLDDARTMLIDTGERLKRAEELAASYPEEGPENTGFTVPTGPDSDLEAEVDAREAEVASAQLVARIVALEQRFSDAADGMAAQDDVPIAADADHSALEVRVDALEARITEMSAGFTTLSNNVSKFAQRADESATLARQAAASARKVDATIASLEERVQKSADARALGSVEARLDNIAEKYDDSVTVCERAGAVSCRSSRDEAVMTFAALGHELDAYRGNVTDVAHQIMTRNACNQGRRMIGWPTNEAGLRANAWDAFSLWYHTNCS